MGIRTPDLLIANETLYQLSYTPTSVSVATWPTFRTAAESVNFDENRELGKQKQRKNAAQ
jgi:hypothetical protein